MRMPRKWDLALGSPQQLSHRRFGGHEGSRDFCCGETAYRTQRESNLGLTGERGMATRQDEPQPIVLFVARRLERHFSELAIVPFVALDAVEGARRAFHSRN